MSPEAIVERDPERAVTPDDNLVSIVDRLSKRFNPKGLTEKEADDITATEEAERKRVQILEAGIEAIPREFREPRPVVSEVLEFMRDYWRGDLDKWGRFSLALVGIPGSGKTQTLYEIQKGLLMQGDPKFQYRNLPKWFLGLEGHSDMSANAAVRRLVDTELCLLDDVGSYKPTKRREELLYNVINERLEQHKPTVVASMLEPSEFGEYIGAHVASRLNRMCRLVKMPDVDYRGEHS